MRQERRPNDRPSWRPGARAGYYFGTGPEGTGFYEDNGKRPSKSAAKKLEIVAPPPADDTGSVVLGLIGHPNVGKSSMVNHLMGEKVVSVKATPGHTKILQTLQLNETTCLCDSPGVVFPRLEVPREAQIVGMLVPLAQVREPFSAIRWVMERAQRPLAELLGLKPVKLRRGSLVGHAAVCSAGHAARLRAERTAGLHEGRHRNPGTSAWALVGGWVAGGAVGRLDAAMARESGEVLSGRIAYSVPPPEPALSGPKPPEDGNDSDWNACDEDFESEADEDRWKRNGKSKTMRVVNMQSWWDACKAGGMPA
eukprot:Skav209560  [mRNA]  locus=scaffold2497:626262:630006:+ [translate_table: standard]